MQFITHGLHVGEFFVWHNDAMRVTIPLPGGIQINITVPIISQAKPQHIPSGLQDILLRDIVTIGVPTAKSHYRRFAEAMLRYNKLKAVFRLAKLVLRGYGYRINADSRFSLKYSVSAVRKPIRQAENM
jgi:hypothetical protein